MGGGRNLLLTPLEICHYNCNSAGESVMPLEKELETYRAKLSQLKDQEGKFVLIHGENVVDVFSSYDDAIKAGYQNFGLTPFLVKQIQSIEQVQFITRYVDPCAQTQPA